MIPRGPRVRTRAAVLDRSKGQAEFRQINLAITFSKILAITSPKAGKLIWKTREILRAGHVGHAEFRELRLVTCG